MEGGDSRARQDCVVDIQLSREPGRPSDLDLDPLTPGAPRPTDDVALSSLIRQLTGLGVGVEGEASSEDARRASCEKRDGAGCQTPGEDVEAAVRQLVMGLPGQLSGGEGPGRGDVECVCEGLARAVSDDAAVSRALVSTLRSLYPGAQHAALLRALELRLDDALQRKLRLVHSLRQQAVRPPLAVTAPRPQGKAGPPGVKERAPGRGAVSSQQVSPSSLLLMKGMLAVLLVCQLLLVVHRGLNGDF